MHITNILAGLPEALIGLGLFLQIALFFIGLVWLVLPFFLLNRLWKIQCEIATASQKAREDMGLTQHALISAHTDMVKRSLALEQRLVDIETRMESFRAPVEEEAPHEDWGA